MENSNGGNTNVGSIGNSIKNERSSIEEDIKILEELRIANENCIKNAKNKDNPFVTIWGKQNRALEHILSDYKKLQEEFKQVDHECDRLEKIDFEKDMKIKELKKENEILKKKIDLMENYMVENGWEICFDNIYAELNNCNGMERDWCRGDELEKQDIHKYFSKKLLESEE